MYCDSLVLIIATEINTNGLLNLDSLFDLNNLNKNHQLSSDNNKKVFRIFEIETPRFFWIDKLVFIRSRAYSFRCGSENMNKFRGISKIKQKSFKFEDFYICLVGSEYHKNLVISYFAQLIMICIFEKTVKLHYQLLMKTDII